MNPFEYGKSFHNKSFQKRIGTPYQVSMLKINTPLKVNIMSKNLIILFPIKIHPHGDNRKDAWLNQNCSCSMFFFKRGGGQTHV